MSTDFSVFDHPRPDVDVELAQRLVADHYGITGTAEHLAGERDRSFRITSAKGQYVLKVGNAADRPDALEGQSRGILWALENDPDLPLAHVVPTTSGKLTGNHQGHTLQLTRYIPGLSPHPPDTTPTRRRNLGTLAARLSQALRGFDHPALHRSFPWTLNQLADLEPLLAHIERDHRSTVGEVLRHFAEETAPALGRLPGQAIHGDINNANIVVGPDDPEIVVGIFDFGDMSWGPRVIEAALTATYQCHHTDPTEAISEVVAAFHVADPLREVEVRLIPDLVMARCAQSILMSARHVATRADNSEYATSDVEPMWETLVRIREVGPAQLAHKLVGVCALGSQGPKGFDEALVLRRSRLGPSLRLSYEKPVHLRKGDGVWLFDNEGNRLLDAYNNVPHVGHAHPRVVAALESQSRRLTTNTRYLVDGVAEYADRLTSLLPEPLSVVLFTNSGSEANDLAYRIARTVTGGRGVVTSANAYHGSTLATAAMSPEELGGNQLESWVAHVDIHDATGVASRFEEAGGVLTERGEKPAMVIFDTVLSSEGILEIPDGMFRSAKTWAEDAGTLFVADEVQAGLGRVGTALWGFATDPVIPDIVTMGKPMGNGYPMGAVITSESIATEFAERAHFFSTFAGSPLACAVGTAVLDVIESEDLASNAEQVGGYLKSESVALRSPDIIDIRGRGLFVGVELTSAELANRVVNGMRRSGILIGATGPDGNVLKIRPPLVFRRHHADLVIEALAAIL